MVKVLASEYNNLRSRISSIMETDYGQSLNANSDVTGDYDTNTVSTDRVSAEQWNNLYIDMIRARMHQDSSFIQQPLWTGDYTTNTSATDKVSQVDYDYLFGLMNDIELNNRTLDINNQSTISSLSTSSRTTGWNTTVQHEFTVTFASAAQRNYFFNAGGQIRFDASIEYTGSDPKTLEWQSLLNNMNSIAMNYTETFSTAGLGSSSLIGNSDLTSSYQLLYQRLASTYSGNNFQIYGRFASSSILQFLVQFNDDSTGNVDELVQGTLNSNGQAVVPDGQVIIGGTPYNTVVLAAPSGNTVSNL